MCVPWELNPQPFGAPNANASTTEHQEHRNFSNKCCPLELSIQINKYISTKKY